MPLSFPSPCHGTPRKATDLRCGLSQAHEGLPFRSGRHGGQLEAMWLQLRDRGEEGWRRQCCRREVRGCPVLLLVSTEVKGHLLADSGRPRPPFVLHGCRDKRQVRAGKAMGEVRRERNVGALRSSDSSTGCFREAGKRSPAQSIRIRTCLRQD